MGRKAPAALVKAVRQLGAWVRSPAYRGGWFQKRSAEGIANGLRHRLLIEKFKESMTVRDVNEWNDAVDWVESDSEETATELLETLARQMPKRASETDDAYEGRLRSARAALKAVP